MPAQGMGGGGAAAASSRRAAFGPFQNLFGRLLAQASSRMIARPGVLCWGWIGSSDCGSWGPAAPSALAVACVQSEGVSIADIACLAGFDRGSLIGAYMHMSSGLVRQPPLGSITTNDLAASPMSCPMRLKSCSLA